MGDWLRNPGWERFLLNQAWSISSPLDFRILQSKADFSLSQFSHRAHMLKLINHLMGRLGCSITAFDCEYLIRRLQNIFLAVESFSSLI